MIKWNDKLPLWSADVTLENLISGVVSVVTDGEYLYGPVDVKRLDGTVWYSIGVFKTFYGEPIRLIDVDNWVDEMGAKGFQRWELMNAYEAQEALAEGLCLRNVEGDYLFLREITDPLGQPDFWVFSLNPEKEGLKLVGCLVSLTYGEDAVKKQYYIYEEPENEVPRCKTKGDKAVEL